MSSVACGTCTNDCCVFHSTGGRGGKPLEQYGVPWSCLSRARLAVLYGACPREQVKEYRATQGWGSGNAPVLSCASGYRNTGPRGEPRNGHRERTAESKCNAPSLFVALPPSSPRQSVGTCDRTCAGRARRTQSPRTANASVDGLRLAVGCPAGRSCMCGCEAGRVGWRRLLPWFDWRINCGLHFAHSGGVLLVG